MKRKEKMIGNRKKSLRKDKQAFTGLEAAIVLTAFVVVAAVFSYVVLNAGFYTTQEAKSTIHTGITQATSSLELAGDVIGYGTGHESTDTLDNITFYLRLTAGNTPVDMNEVTVTYTDSNRHVVLSKVTGTPGENNEWSYLLSGGDSDTLLEKSEKVEIMADFTDLNVNDDFSIEVKPPQGTTVGIERTVPAAIYEVMNLH